MLDEIDFAILTYLQSDATITNAELAKKIELSPSSCLGRTKRLKESGIIKRYAVIVDEKKIGLEIVTYVFVTLSPHDRKTTEAFLERIREIQNVVECHNISGVYDYLLKIVSPSIQEYRDFVIDTLIEAPGVGKVETSVVLSTEKQSFQLPLVKSKLWKDRG
ncbi:MAG: Lrp/AsnC family transcriptional regulator [Proteobacteria bacterium]|nr:Lrp/AsnC family transcriptional regulator [Desulfobulbaceae bacterium]MBU4154160.1 Lrp/AsnC family transcriptional regulator [Pseudomonadota bacterium]